MSGIRRLWLVAVVAAAFVLVPAAQADVDTTPPELVALALPARLMTGPAPTAVVQAQVTDDLSGVAVVGSKACPAPAAGVSFVGLRHGSTHVSALFVGAGVDGYEARVRLPRWAPGGEWLVEHVALVDCAGNSRTLHRSELELGGFPARFVVDGEGDDTEPTLSKLSIAPASVDITAGAAEVSVTASLFDDLSGVATGDADAACGGFAPSRSFVSFESAADSGYRVGVFFEPFVGNLYRATLSLPRFAPTGTWTITAVTVADCAGNVVEVDTAELAARGLPTTFQVTGTSDTEAPQLAALSLSASVLDTRAAGAALGVSARITDDVSGVSVAGGCSSSSLVLATSPSGAYVVGGLRHLAGEEYETTIDLPRHAEAGTWTVALVLHDCAGNGREIAPAQLAALGLPGSFEVLPPLYAFGGFMAPLDETALAQRTRGSAMAVKFTLGGAQGTDVFDAGFPQVQPVDCETRAPLGDAVSLGPTEWVFQDLAAGLYHFKWKSSHDWHNVCRRLILGFDDGSRHAADVRFK
jgi:hypothetical protein